MNGSRWMGAAVVLTMALLTACSSSSSSSAAESATAASTSSSAASNGTTITIKDFAFSPDALTLPAGEVTLTVTNEDSTTHSFTLDDDSVTTDIAPGTTEQVTVTVPASGSLGWHCRFHSTMTGTITSSG
jgi:plastocyanin